jgi:DNA-binding response OmpR family regulator
MQDVKARALLLVPDDSRRRRVRAALERDGHEVLSSRSGRQAADLLKDSRHVPDVVVLDMALSARDGADFAAAYRRVPGQHPPIIIVPAPEQTDQPVRQRLVEEDEDVAEALDEMDGDDETSLSSAALELLRARVRVHGSTLAEQRRTSRRRPASVIAAGAGIAAALVVGVMAAAPAFAWGS